MSESSTIPSPPPMMISDRDDALVLHPPLPPADTITTTSNTIITANMNKESTLLLTNRYTFGRSSSSTSPFPDYIDFNITETLAQDINNRIQSHKSQIHPAMIYSFIEKKAIESQQHRKKSFKKSFRDSSLEEDIFNKQLIPLIESIFSVAYSHLEVHITVGEQHFDYICYESGGYFEKHRDFTRINADSIHQQYTMLIGLTSTERRFSSDSISGHTILWYPIYPGVENYVELFSDYEILTRVRDPKYESARYFSHILNQMSEEERNDWDLFHKICDKYCIYSKRYEFCQSLLNSLPMIYQSDEEDDDKERCTDSQLTVTKSTTDISTIPSTDIKYIPRYFQAHLLGKCLIFKSSLLHSGEMFISKESDKLKELLMITINIAALPKAALPINNTLADATPANPTMGIGATLPPIVISRPVVLYDHFQPWMISAVAEHHVIPFQLILIQGSYNGRNFCDYHVCYWNFNTDVVPVAANPTSTGLVESMSDCLQELYDETKSKYHYRRREEFIAHEVEEVESRVSETWRQRVDNHARFVPWWNDGNEGKDEQHESTLKAVEERVELFILNFKAQFEEENCVAYKEKVINTWEESGCNDSGDEYDETTYFDCKIDIKFGFARYTL